MYAVVVVVADSTVAYGDAVAECVNYPNHVQLIYAGIDQVTLYFFQAYFICEFVFFLCCIRLSDFSLADASFLFLFCYFF